MRPLRLGFAEPPPLEGGGLGFAHSKGFPYEGKLPPQAADEVGCVAQTEVPHLIRHGFRRATFPS